MAIDNELIDKLISTRSSHGSRFIPTLPSYSPLAMDHNILRESLERLREDLEKRNPLKEIEEVQIVDSKVRVPLGGKFGQLLNIYRVVTEQTSERVTRHLSLEEAMPRIIDDVQYVSGSLESAAKSVREVIKSRDGVISTMEEESAKYMGLLTETRREFDVVKDQMVQCQEQLEAIETELIDQCHKDDIYTLNKNRRDGLERRLKRCEADLSLLSQDARGTEALKRRNDEMILKYIGENQGLMVYVQIAEVSKEYIKQQIRAGQMSFQAVMTVAKMMGAFADTSSKMVGYNSFGSDLQDSLKNLLSLYSPQNGKKRGQLTTGQ